MTLSTLARRSLVLVAANGFIVVALGAFGAHILEEVISENMLAVFQTGIHYHMLHVGSFLAVAMLASLKGDTRSLDICTWLFCTGILLFSGSLYLLALTGVRALGMITPMGGLAFLAGWALLGYEVIKT